MPRKTQQMVHENRSRKRHPGNVRLNSKSVSFYLKKYIYRDTKLFYEANKRKEEGQADLAVFVLARSSKSLNDLIENTWKMNNAKASIEREKQR